MEGTRKVFVSHSSKGKPVVRVLPERLRARRFRGWSDCWQVQAHDSTPVKSEEGPEHSRVLELCTSPEISASDWMRLEDVTSPLRAHLNGIDHERQRRADFGEPDVIPLHEIEFVRLHLADRSHRARSKHPASETSSPKSPRTLT